MNYSQYDLQQIDKLLHPRPSIKERITSVLRRIFFLKGSP